MVFGSAFYEILEKRRMTLASLADRAELGESRIEELLGSDEFPADEEAESIANALGVPVRALFAKSAEQLSDLPDFRRNNPRPSLLDSGSIKAIAWVEKISLSLAESGINLDADIEFYQGKMTKAAAARLAGQWRAKWGMTNGEQLELRDANKLYSSFRAFVERLGIFVMHFSFGSDEVSGMYTKIDGGPHSIVINTTGSSKARKLFTLAHEFGHVLLRKDGVSNPSVVKNKVEKFCNQFAAHILAPYGLIAEALRRFKYDPSINGDMLRLLAKNLGISQQACILRLVDTGYLGQSDYARWISRFNSVIPSVDSSDGSGGGGGDPIQNKRTQYGSSLLKKLSEAYQKGILDSIEIYRLAGIKPKYQRELIGG